MPKKRAELALPGLVGRAERLGRRPGRGRDPAVLSAADHRHGQRPLVQGAGEVGTEDRLAGQRRLDLRLGREVALIPGALQHDGSIGRDERKAAGRVEERDRLRPEHPHARDPLLESVQVESDDEHADRRIGVAKDRDRHASRRLAVAPSYDELERRRLAGLDRVSEVRAVRDVDRRWTILVRHADEVAGRGEDEEGLVLVVPRAEPTKPWRHDGRIERLDHRLAGDRLAERDRLVEGRVDQRGGTPRRLEQALQHDLAAPIVGRVERHEQQPEDRDQHQQRAEQELGTEADGPQPGSEHVGAASRSSSTLQCSHGVTRPLWRVRSIVHVRVCPDSTPLPIGVSMAWVRDSRE